MKSQLGSFTKQPTFDALISDFQHLFADNYRKDSNSTTASAIIELYEAQARLQTNSTYEPQTPLQKQLTLPFPAPQPHSPLHNRELPVPLLGSMSEQNEGSQFSEEPQNSKDDQEMGSSASGSGKRARYDKVDTTKRKRLLELVDEMGHSIKSASVEIGINYSTAKTILQLYRRSGRIERLPHHKTLPTKQKCQNLKVKIFKVNMESEVTPLDRKAKIVKKEHQPTFAPVVDHAGLKSPKSASSFCTKLLLDLACDRKEKDIISPLLPIPEKASYPASRFQQ